MALLSSFGKRRPTLDRDPALRLKPVGSLGGGRSRFIRRAAGPTGPSAVRRTSIFGFIASRSEIDQAWCSGLLGETLIPPSIARVSPRRLPSIAGPIARSPLRWKEVSEAEQRPGPERRATSPNPTTRSEAPRLRTVTGNPSRASAPAGAAARFPATPSCATSWTSAARNRSRPTSASTRPTSGPTAVGSLRRLVPPTSSDSSSRIGLRTSLRTRASLEAYNSRHYRRDTVSRDEKSRPELRPPCGKPRRRPNAMRDTQDWVEVPFFRKPGPDGRLIAGAFRSGRATWEIWSRPQGTCSAPSGNYVLR